MGCRTLQNTELYVCMLQRSHCPVPHPNKSLMSSAGLNDVNLGKGGAMCMCVRQGEVCVLGVLACVPNLLTVAKFMSVVCSVIFCLVRRFQSVFCCISVERNCVIIILITMISV